MKTNIIFRLSVILISFIENIQLLICSADCDYQHSIYYLKPEDKAYLKYFVFENSFDSEYVRCQIGEFRIVNGENESRVNLVNTTDSCIEGDSVSGEDKKLLQYSFTEPFIMPENGQVKFFRRLMAKSPCDMLPGGGGPAWGGTGDWRDDHCYVGIGRILDNTTFVIQLIRASDTTVIATIDSVGVAPNPNSQLAQRYGTAPDVMNHIRDLPSGYGGVPCYFRVSTRRWGPTPLGLSYRIKPSWSSYSHVREYDSATIFRCDFSTHYLLEDHYSNYLLNYLDSVKKATGKLPDYSIMPLSDFMDSLINARYYEMHIHNGDTIWVEIMDSSYYQKRGDYREGDKSEEQAKKSIHIEQISPQPITTGISRIIIQSALSNESAAIELYSANGERLKTLWKNILFKGDNIATINLSEFNPGVYIISLKNEAGETLDYMKIIITK